MRKLFSLFIMAVVLHANSQAHILKYLIGIDIDIQFGQNKVINDKRYECIDDGICRIRVSAIDKGDEDNNPILWHSEELASLANHSVPKLVINQEDGGLYLALSSLYASTRPEFSGAYTTSSITEISLNLINLINEKIREVNPSANLFQGITEGKILNMTEQNGVRFVKLN